MFNERADKFTYITPTGRPKKVKIISKTKGKMDQSLTKAKSPAGYERRSKLAKLKKIGNIKDSVGVPKLDKKNKPIMVEPGMTPSGERISVSNKAKRPLIERKNMLPKLVAQKTSKVQKDIKKERGKIAKLTQNTPEQAKVKGANLKKGATMKVKTNPDFSKKQGVVTGTAYDERGNKLKTSDYAKATALGGAGGVISEKARLESRAKEAKLLDSAENKAKRSNFDSLNGEQQEKLIKQTMKRKKMNRRGAVSYLKKLKNLGKLVAKGVRKLR